MTDQRICGGGGQERMGTANICIIKSHNFTEQPLQRKLIASACAIFWVQSRKFNCRDLLLLLRPLRFVSAGNMKLLSQGSCCDR